MRIVRSAIRKDVFSFLLPAGLIYCAELLICAWNLVRRQESLHVSLQTSVGLVLVVAGLSICLVSAFTLGRFYSSSLVIKEGHRLISRGVYRFVRHPIYLGALLKCLGIPVFVSSWYGAFAWVALIPFVLWRVRNEEELLTEQFGDEYRAYKTTTNKLVPFLY